ncbi:helix-turn-helix domain-containing protein [Bifidobacterium sp. SO4]|uniref:PucR family transcriptional regulator n=1 Tax=Bifidobacterium sp. SO4 TaxID=2809030 RepID=UPI001F0B090F|nr:helix-turn-helix domain-containing protein [Bifidobacterium sp. SO4]
MPSDFLELLASEAADSSDATALDRVRTVLFECLFHHLADDRVDSLFAILGFEDGFDCYAIAGYPARSAAKTRKDVEKIVSDFGGACLTAEYAMNGLGPGIAGSTGTVAPSAAGNSTGNPVSGGTESSASAGPSGSARGASTVANRPYSRADKRNTAVVALIRPVGAATPEVICNTVSPAFDATRPLALGPQRTGSEGAMRTMQAALYCLKAAPALAATVQQIPRPLRTDDALPERALIGDEDARDELIRVVYGSLTAAGPDDPTLLTVSTFLRFGGSLETCAKELNVHPNTIRYRLKRAAESTGWDATDPREAYVLTTAIALGRMAG